MEEWDFRASGALDETIVALHAHKPTGTDQDLVLEFDTSCDEPAHLRTFLVGKGDLNVSSGLGAALRFDFATVALLGDGRAATSIVDSQHTTPSLAIETETSLDEGVELPDPACG